MPQPARKKAIYENLNAIPENATGEIIDGELIVTPRPSRNHVFAATALGGELTPPYQFARGGGPGGWIILIEPEIKLDEDILVPDLAAWRKERFPTSEEHNWISVVPDWVCEILSPYSLRTDKIKKMPLYARSGVRFLWLIDPAAKTVDTFRLVSSSWLLIGIYAENDKMTIEPFPETVIDLSNLWLG